MYSALVDEMTCLVVFFDDQLTTITKELSTARCASLSVLTTDDLRLAYHAVSAMVVLWIPKTLLCSWRYERPIPRGLIQFCSPTMGGPIWLDRLHPWRILMPEETLTKCHTMPGVPALTRKVLSSDG
ncbi:hypothetical protein Tco_0807309 [Tanacetum coccineum]